MMALRGRLIPAGRRAETQGIQAMQTKVESGYRVRFDEGSIHLWSDKNGVIDYFELAVSNYKSARAAIERWSEKFELQPNVLQELADYCRCVGVPVPGDEQKVKPQHRVDLLKALHGIADANGIARLIESAEIAALYGNPNQIKEALNALHDGAAYIVNETGELIADTDDI